MVRGRTTFLFRSRLDLRRRSHHQRTIDAFGRPAESQRGSCCNKTTEEESSEGIDVRALQGIASAPTRTFEVFMNVSATASRAQVGIAAIRASRIRRPVARCRELRGHRQAGRVCRVQADLPQGARPHQEDHRGRLPEPFRVEVSREQEAAIRSALGQLAGVASRRGSCSAGGAEYKSRTVFRRQTLRSDRRRRLQRVKCTVSGSGGPTPMTRDRNGRQSATRKSRISGNAAGSWREERVAALVHVQLGCPGPRSTIASAVRERRDAVEAPGGHERRAA